MSTASALAISMAVVGGAHAQAATSTIRGNVTDGTAVEADATIVARNVASGFTSRTTANAQGGFTLRVLARTRPTSAGSARISAPSPRLSKKTSTPVS